MLDLRARARLSAPAEPGAAIESDREAVRAFTTTSGGQLRSAGERQEGLRGSVSSTMCATVACLRTTR